MSLTRYYIPHGVFTSKEELENDPNTPDKPFGDMLWESYVKGKLYISVWVTEEGVNWGYFSTNSLGWARENGYQPFQRESEEVLI